MIRLQCEQCGKPLTVQNDRAGAVGTCPHCKEQFRVPRSQASPTEEGHDSEDRFAFSRSGLLKGLLWFLGFASIAFVVMVCSVIGCVLIVVNGPLSFEMIWKWVFLALAAMAGGCYFLMALPNWRLFFFSAIPSSSYYLVKSDRLVRYSRANRVVEEVPFANIAAVRMLTRRNVENPEITAKVLGIDLRNLDDPQTILDRQFCRWSQKMHRHDLVMIDDFFDVPLKTVYRKIKKRWEVWQETHPVTVKEARPTSRPRELLAWYQKPLTYVFAGLGLMGVIGLVLLVSLVSLLVRGKKDGKAATPPAAEAARSTPQISKPVEHFGPASLPGLAAYWPLDEGQGQAASDASGNGSLGSLHGGEWLPGVQGSAVRLDGKGDFVDLGSERRLDFGPAGPFTLAGWVTARSNGVICSFRRRASLFPVIELSVRRGHLHGWVRDDTSGFGGVNLDGASVNDAKWHHVALLRQGDGTIELFLDGASQGSAKGNSSGGPITTDLRTLGCDRLMMIRQKRDPGYLAGDLDEFCVYTRPLGPAEIATLAGRKQ
jgi:hypothetical protein